MKTGIVCEGGGMRGIFTSGVLQAFMDEGFVADELVGVSAGASNGVSYVSGQHGRGKRTNADYAGDKRYVSWRNYIRTGSVFGMDFIFGQIPETLDPFDYEAFQHSATDYYAGLTSLATGKAVFFGKQHIVPPLTVLRASCSIPMLAPVMVYNGQEYLDGGVAAPIPIQKAQQDGCEKLVVILTRPKGYRKTAQKGRALYHRIYKDYPNFAKAIDVRHLVYNHTLETLARMEKDGRAIVVAPQGPLAVDRLGKDRQKLLQAYDEGLSCGLQALQKL